MSRCEIWKELQSSLKYEMYELVDSVPYGTWQLSVFYDRETVIIHLEDDSHEAIASLPIEEMRKFEEKEFFEFVNSVIYYNSVDKEDSIED